MQPALGDGIVQCGLARKAAVDIGVAHLERTRDIDDGGLCRAVPAQKCRRLEDALFHQQGGCAVGLSDSKRVA